MPTLTFPDTHNMVAFLEKPGESNRFHEIIDFLNANQIHCALTVNPTIYTSCIEQFWATAKVKTVNGERQIQALVDKKKVIITETSIRSDLHLEDADGTDCLPTATIFEELARMGTYLKSLLKDQLLEASLAEDIKNLVITSCVEIRNKVLHDETERISKASNDVSNESKIADTVCNDAFKVTQELSKRIVELEKDLSKFEAKSIAFEIALQHKSRENNSLKTLQKENENFMASLQIENAHLKQTYKDLFESVQRSRVETNECDEVKVKVNFDEIETKNIELEHRVASLIKENEHLKLWKRISDKRTKNEAKNDKTEHGMEKREKSKSKSTLKSQRSKPKPSTKKSLMGPPVPI
ncbi:hypothetical protein Tco_0762251 [Tanacetum coccineum]